MMVSRRTYAGRAIGFAARQAAGIGQRLRDRRRPTYLECAFGNLPRLRCLQPIETSLLKAHRDRIAGLAANYLEHRFDLLGSGWTQVRHGMDCRGVEGLRRAGGSPAAADPDGRWLKGRINQSNLAHSQRIWRLIDPGYEPIDWQRDFKSGHRWAENTWYLDIRYGHRPGVDIKVPWELARMQHLPQMAWWYALARADASDCGAADRCAAEFRNQVLDFIATNPPRFGVNWRSAMEAAIRAANWIVAAELFGAYGAVFDAQFENIFSRSLCDHGLYIEANLEWDAQVRGNHYLANVAGLLFIAAVLPRAPKTDAWLAFAVRELVREAEFQFAPDGSHREASTGYHALTAEMMTWATALVLALPAEKMQALCAYDHRQMDTAPALAPAPVPIHSNGTPFPDWYFDRLQRMGEFVAHITKPGGRMAQIGDHDSGRFIRFDAAYARMTAAQARSRYANLDGYRELPDGAAYWDQNHLDRRGLLAAIGALTGRGDLLAAAGEGWLEAAIMRGLIPPRFKPPARPAAAVGGEHRIATLRDELCARGRTRTYEFQAAGGDLREGLICHSYPDFGLFIARSQRLYLAIRCGRFGLTGNGGHAHHDQLSIELWLDGRDLILDPGTYVYTALSRRREEYRGPLAHFAPQVEGRDAQGSGPGLFQMRDRAAARCLYFGADGFAGCHRGFGPMVFRVIEILPGAIRITDAIEGQGRLRQLTPAPGWRCGWRESPRYSPAYGVVMRDEDCH